MMNILLCILSGRAKWGFVISVWLQICEYYNDVRCMSGYPNAQVLVYSAGDSWPEIHLTLKFRPLPTVHPSVNEDLVETLGRYGDDERNWQP